MVSELTDYALGGCSVAGLETIGTTLVATKCGQEKVLFYEMNE